MAELDTEATPAAPDAATQAPPRTPTPTETFVEQYEIDEGDLLPATPAATAPEAELTAPPLEHPSAPRERDPATGRFVTPPEAAPSPHSPRLVRMAKDLGLDDGEINSIPAERLDEIVYHLNKQALSQARTSSIERTLAGATERPLASQQPDPAAAAVVPADDDLGLDEAQYDPGLLKAFKKLQDAGQASAKKIKELEGQLQQVTQRQAARANETMANRIDRAFVKHKAHVGEGRGAELAEGSREYQRRIAILTMVDRDKGKGSLEAKIDKAVSDLYGEARRPPVTVLPDPLEARRQAWNDGTLARPTQRQPSDLPNGSRKAERSVAAALAEMGVAEESGEAGADDFLE